MAHSSDEEADSRTALVGAPRTRSNPHSTTRSASHDSSSRPAKRQRRNRNKTESDLKDFVPRGGAFTANSLPVDPDSTSSSGSSSESSEDSGADTDSDTAPTNPHAGNTAPAISWNQGRKAAVRTSLGKRSAPTNEKSAQFEVVNDKYWRSRSESVSSANGEDKPAHVESQKDDQPQKEGELEDGEIDSRSESSDSVSLDSEADNSILLNIGDKMETDGANDYNPADLAHQHGLPKDILHSTGPGSKEEAFRLFSSKYPNAPTALVDLNKEDFETQAKYVYFDRNIHDIDLKLPISCIECQCEGHLAEVCPAKECTHCGAWNQHQSSICPGWRRCQKCRERGHDEPGCPSKLRNFASEVPCDNCNQPHLESQCDHLWKYPIRDLHSEQVTVSICCANCMSSKHLIGDCEASSRRLPLTSSSFTLKGIDPNMITNLNAPRNRGSSAQGRNRDWSRPSSPGRGRPGPPSRGNNRNYRPRSPSSEEDDMMSRVSRGRGRPVPQPRGNTRGNIKFAVGAKRGRSPFSGNNSRSHSPPPLPRGPPPSRGYGRGRGSQRGGSSREPRGRGRGRGW